MIGDIDVQKLSCAEFDDHEYGKTPESCGDNRQEIAGHDHFGVNVDKD